MFSPHARSWVATMMGTMYHGSTLPALRNTWRPKMHSYAVGSSHKTIEGPNWAPYPATKRTEPGRSRTNRIHGDMDEANATHSLRKCKICKQPGHDRRNCPQRQ